MDQPNHPSPKSEYQTSNRKDHDYEPSENSPPPKSKSKCDLQKYNFPYLKILRPALIVSKQGLNTSFGENGSINDKTTDVVFATPLSAIRMEENSKNSKASTEYLLAEIQDLQKTSGENSMEFFVPKDD